MTKREIFDHIIDACARVCNVSVDEIMEGRKHNALFFAYVGNMWAKVKKKTARNPYFAGFLAIFVRSL